MSKHLADNGTGLAHVVEKLVIENHYRAGHGPQIDKPPFESCPMDACVTWRRFLAERMPD